MAFRDGLGERRTSKDSAAASVEALCLRPELAAVPSFEFALRERVTRLTGFRHAYYAPVRGVERSSEFDQALTVLSDATPGIRLSALLDTAHEQRLPVDLDVALCLIRQLVPAVAILHETARDASHGAIGPERLIVTPKGRLVIGEYMLGSALEQLLFTRERYWTELRIALPRVVGLPRFDHLADVTQVGIVALSLILGRTLREEEYPARISEVVASAAATSADGKHEPLPTGLRSWLQRALQLDARGSFPSAIEARVEFERVLAGSGYDASPGSLDAFLNRYHALGSSSDLKVTVATGPTPIHFATPAVQPLSLPIVPVVPFVAPPPIVPVTAVPSPISAVEPPPREPQVIEPPPQGMPSFDREEAEFVVENSVMSARRGGGKLVRIAAAVAVGVAVLGTVALIGARRFWAAVPAPTTTGTLVVTTNPDGAEAYVDGVRRGNTPISVTLLAGSHRVELRGHGEPRVIPVTIAPGQQVAQYVDLPSPPPAVETKPELVSEPAAVERAAPEPPANGPGWIAVTGKVEVQLFESGHLLGTSSIERIMVPAGHHDLELVSDLIGYRATRSIQVAPGKVFTLNVEVPKGSVAINAVPWAEVWMDGAKIGDTPIGNFAVATGSHDVVFRHPDLGERRETVLVTLKNPVRLSVDMRKP